MFVKVLKSKIHGATVTQTDPDYVGSITIDEDLLRASGIRPNEVVLIADGDNGQRFETYVIKGPAGSGVIGINGAASRLVERGHKVIIFSHLHLHPDQPGSVRAKCDGLSTGDCGRAEPHRAGADLPQFAQRVDSDSVTTWWVRLAAATVVGRRLPGFFQIA